MAARRSLLAMSLLGLSLALTGCESMDPAYWIPDNKKKLPGDRREVFPEGVPGVVQGVPPELIKGNNALVESDPAANAPQAAAPQAEPPAEEKPKPKARPSKAARPAAPPAETQPKQRAAQPAPAAPRPAQPAANGGWPAAQPQASQQPQAAPSASGWPAPPPSGTFTR